MYKILEQQVNHKVLLVVKSCHYNENFQKIANIVYTQMPAHWELPNKSSSPRQQLGYKSPRGGTKVWCKFSGVRRGGGMVMDKIDNCIILTF